MTVDRGVTATFAAPPGLVTLTVTKLGAGNGAINSDPPGITNCTTTCSAGFAPGSIVV